MYHALYRKYRPRDFNSVVGQDTIIKTLKNSIKNQSFTHAYMFFGPRGVGKTTVSKIFARAVNCLDTVDGDACGKCDNCKKSGVKECVDIIEIDAASNNGVDEIRELKNKISLVPAELKYKVYIIDEVHMLSIGAFNALLKTLEEPPEHAIFILATTDPQKIPETIISRCQCFSFQRISPEIITQKLKKICDLEHISIDDEVLTEISISCDGGLRDALGMLDKLSSYTKERITIVDYVELNGTITKNELSEFVNSIFQADISSVLEKLSLFHNQGKNLVQIVYQIMYFLRDMVVDYYIHNVNFEYSVDKTEDLINLINEKMFDIKKSGNPKIYIEMMLLSFIRRKIMNEKSTKNISREIIFQGKDEMSLSNKIDSAINSSRDIQKSNITEETEKNVDSASVEGEVSDQAITNSGFHFTSSRILNQDEINAARVNNTLALANKQILNSIVDNMKIFNDYTFDLNIGYIACALLDAKVRAASENEVILSYEYDSIVKQNLDNLNKITEVYNKFTNSNMKFAIITDEKWEQEKNNYILSIKNGKHYSVVSEPDEVLEENENNDIITNSAIELFGDIVEID